MSAYASNDVDIEKVEISKEVKVNMQSNDDGTVKATVTTVTSENGKESTNTQTFEGTETEVEAKIDALKDEGDDVDMKVKKVIKEVKQEVNN